MVVAILLLATIFSSSLPIGFGLVLCAYLSLVLIYTIKLKYVVGLDVAVLAVFYMGRLVAGHFVIGVAPSHWILSFSFFLFLSLALVKRYIEVPRNLHVVRRLSYGPSSKKYIWIAGNLANAIAFVMFVSFISAQSESARYLHPPFLLLAASTILLWNLRLWDRAKRNAITQDLVQFSVMDRLSWIGFGLVILSWYLARGRF